MLSSPLWQATSHENKSFLAFGDELKQDLKEIPSDSEAIVDDHADNRRSTLRFSYCRLAFYYYQHHAFTAVDCPWINLLIANGYY